MWNTRLWSLHCHTPMRMRPWHLRKYDHVDFLLFASTVTCRCSWISMFVNIDIQYIDFLWFPILKPVLWPFVTSSDESGWDHMAVKSAFSAVLPLCRSVSTELRFSVRLDLISFMLFEWDILLIVELSGASKSDFILLNINLHDFHALPPLTPPPFSRCCETTTCRSATDFIPCRSHIFKNCS